MKTSVVLAGSAIYAGFLAAVTLGLTSLVVFSVRGIFHYPLPFWPTSAGVFVLGFLLSGRSSK